MCAPRTNLAALHASISPHGPWTIDHGFWIETGFGTNGYILSERASQEEQNGVNISFITPSSRGGGGGGGGVGREGVKGPQK